jgi:hypothetical protein
VVTAANVSDGRGACKLLERMPPEKFPRLTGYPEQVGAINCSG